MLHCHDITTQIKPFTLSDKEQVAAKWQDLEARANNSVFISWLWIGNWLDLVTDKLFMVECYQGEKLVGLAFFVEKVRKVFGLIPIKQWQLHRTGNTQQDQIWIEHNDFLLDSSVEEVARLQMVQAVCDYDASMKEVIVGLSSKNILTSFQQCFPQSSLLMQTLAYVVDFSKIEKSYLNEVLSKNTRSQLNRSNKILNQLGDLAFSVVTESEKIELLYDDIAKIHIERWGNTKEGSGFSNNMFTAFHQQLVNDNGCTVQIAVLSLNQKPLGYLVNFIYKHKVYFYLSALIVLDNSKIKVGLTLHEKAIDYYATRGMKYYDFLGGEARYKDSMSNFQYILSMKSFHRNSYILTTERVLKVIKSKVTLLLSKNID